MYALVFCFFSVCFVFFSTKLTHLAGITLLAGVARTLTPPLTFMFSSNAHQAGSLLISLTIFSPNYSDANLLCLLQKLKGT